MKTKCILLLLTCLFTVVLFSIKPSTESERARAKASIENIFGEQVYNVDVGYAASGTLSVGFTDKVGDLYVVHISNGYVEHPEWLIEKKDTFRKSPNLHYQPRAIAQK